MSADHGSGAGDSVFGDLMAVAQKQRETLGKICRMTEEAIHQGIWIEEEIGLLRHRLERIEDGVRKTEKSTTPTCENTEKESAIHRYRNREKRREYTCERRKNEV